MILASMVKILLHIRLDSPVNQHLLGQCCDTETLRPLRFTFEKGIIEIGASIELIAMDPEGYHYQLITDRNLEAWEIAVIRRTWGGV